VQAHEGFEDEEAWAERGGEAVAIPGVIEAEDRRGDHVHVQGGEVDAGGAADAVETAAAEVQRVLGSIEQHAARSRDQVVAQAGGAGGDRDGQVGGEKRPVPGRQLTSIPSDPPPMVKPRLHALREHHVREERQSEEGPVEGRKVPEAECGPQR